MASWEGVTEFVAVAETESFTAAAKRLNSSVANISRQIRALENRLATKLFHRTTRPAGIEAGGYGGFRDGRSLLRSDLRPGS